MGAVYLGFFIQFWLILRVSNSGFIESIIVVICFVNFGGMTVVFGVSALVLVLRPLLKLIFQYDISLTS
jgi:hypothetical protein